MQNILELKQVSAGYKDNIILEDVDFTVSPTGFVGVIGANGSGKTTLLRIILGLNKPMKGQVLFHFNGVGCTAGSKAASQHIGYLPQVAMFDRKFPMTVHDVVLSGLTGKIGLFKHFSRTHRDKADQVMQQMKIHHLRKMSIGELSGGQMQRVFLARALINEPRLLLLDEPNTFIDKGFEKGFFDVLKELNKTIAIVLVSHDIGMVSSFVKTIACVNRSVYHHDGNEVTREILENYNCPIDLITHGELPHRVLKTHPHQEGAVCHCLLNAKQVQK